MDSLPDTRPQIVELPPVKRSYAILGTGALGGFYGARLQQAGLEVHFLLHSDYEHVRQQGLRVESPQGDFSLPQVHAYHTVQDMPRCDVVVVALKTTQNHLLPKLLPAVVKKQGAVLVLQNGLGLEAEVAEILKGDRSMATGVQIIGGLCFICSNKVGPGHIRHLDYGAITLATHLTAAKANPSLDWLPAIAHDFEQAKISIHSSPDLALARWRKLVWNIPYNGLSVVLNATTDELMADAHTYALVKQLMGEVIAAAAACGTEIAADFIQQMLDATLKMKPYRTSMKIDYDEGRPLEVEAIYGNSVRAAQQAGVEVPRMAMLYQQLKFLDAQTQALKGRSPAIPVQAPAETALSSGSRLTPKR